MQKNVSGQKIGCQMVSATDGSAFTGSVTVYVTGDAGTQAAGSVGSGACTHEGNGYHTYAPAQAETNYDLVAFTFIGTGAVPSTVQVFTGFPQTGDAYARLGAPAGASVSADVASVKAQTAAIETDTQDLQTQIGTDGAGLTNIPTIAAVTTVTNLTNLPAAAATAAELAKVPKSDSTVSWNATALAAINAQADTALADYDAPTKTELDSAVAALATAANLATLAGYVDTEVAAILAAVDTEVAAIKTKTDYLPSATAGAAGGVFIAGSNAATSVTTALTANITGDLSGSVGSVTGAVGSVTGAVGSVTGAVGSVTGNVGGNVVGSVGSVSGDTKQTADVAALITTVGVAGAGLTALATQASVNTIDDFLDTEVAAIKAVADKLDTALVLDGAVYQFTANALELAPTGGSAPSAADIRAEIDANSTQLAAIVADTQDLQTQIGTDGAGLTALGDTRLANLDATVSSRNATTPPTAASIADAVLDEAMAGHSGAGSFGKIVVDILDDTSTSLPLAIVSITPQSAAAIRAEIDSNSTQLAAILEDTGTTLPGTLATIAGYVDTEVAAILAAVDTEVAAIKAKTDNLPASPAAVGSAMTLTSAYDAAKTAATQTSVDDLPTNSELATALAGADDAVLAAIAALNNLSSAQAQTAAAAALTAYDPPTNAEMEARTLAAASYATASALDAVDNFVDTEVAAIKAVTDKLDTTLVLDGAVYDFTAAALAAAPSSSGGDATAANQTAILAALADVPTDVDTELTASHGAGVWGAAGSGLLTDTITVNDGTDPLDGVLVQVATDSNLSNIIRSGYTNGLGQVTFHYDAAGTYYGRAEIATFNVLTFEITVS